MPTSNPELRRLEERVNQSRDSVFKKYGYWPSQLEEMRRQMATASGNSTADYVGLWRYPERFWKMVDLGIAETESLEAIVAEFRVSGLFTSRCVSEPISMVGRGRDLSCADAISGSRSRTAAEAMRLGALRCCLSTRF